MLYLLPCPNINIMLAFLYQQAYNGEIQLFEMNNALERGASYAEANSSAGSVYAKMKEYDKAKICYEKTLTSLSKGCNEKVASTLDALGTINMEEGRQHEAKEILTGAFNMFKECLGTHHDNTVSTALKLAQHQDQMEDYEIAMSYYEICLAARENKHGKNHEEVATILFLMGRNSFSQNAFADALAFLERVSLTCTKV